MPKLTRTKQADIDLLDIWQFIAKDNSIAADKTIRNLDTRSQELRTHPRLGISRKDVAPNMRQLVMGNYLILYRIIGNDNDIEIVRFLHGARDLFSLFE